MDVQDGKRVSVLLGILILTIATSVQLFTSEEFSTLKLSQSSIMQFIYLGEAKFWRKNKWILRGFLEFRNQGSVNWNTYRWYDQPESNEESNEHKDNVRHVDTAQTVNEDVEYQTQTSSMVSKLIIRINRARRRWRTEVVSKEAKFTCQDCERMLDTLAAGLWYHTKSKHESVRNACYQCDKLFTQQGHVVTHI